MVRSESKQKDQCVLATMLMTLSLLSILIKFEATVALEYLYLI